MLSSSAATTTRQVLRRSLLRPAATASRSYHLNVVEHYENPRNVGSLDKTDKSVGTGLVGAPACGDVMKLQLQFSEDGKTIVDSKFKTFGCGSAIAASSVATEWVKNKTVEEVLEIENTDIAAHLKLPPVKLHCSMLAEDAIRAAVSDWKSKNNIVDDHDHHHDHHHAHDDHEEKHHVA
mmetsp:Transcript_19449/g.22248  ORF Transcript_19449/g.22248 Transcript_19449/m.22248 type:complete len:179 (+) Transcript_19449:171-707(+)|eukprot:CAMPEP_0194131584 /NCGR_PEP_ID=MMETSP0152-20130528/2332_1 /TAXON_ID=1049557 /ORGANISM="Thalassiothrix antarctica, Strain L6-D1" /LENGTH=178 /DNA_ID=CAMNT_0038826423 /DNA_START=130 /DNA_END=666 /DNA_ORIENTATION=+